MTEGQYQRGWEMLQRISGEPGVEVMESLNDTAPDLGRYIVEFVYGEMYTRPGLELRSRQLVAIAALSALGNARPQLKVHIGGALNVGCTREEIVEAIMHAGIFAGFPSALNGVSAAAEVFAARDQEAAP